MFRKMSPKQTFKIQNLIELREIKNFKTKKIKIKRIKQKHRHQWFLRSSSLYLNHYYHQKHHALQPHHQFKCKSPSPPSQSQSQSTSPTYFNYLRINQIIESSSSSVRVSGLSLVQVRSALQLSIISTSCFKMSLIIVLFLSTIIASHIANCQAKIYESDNKILFFSNLNKNNSLSDQHILQNVYKKSLIEDRESTITGYSKIVTNSAESTKLKTTTMTTSASSAALEIIDIKTNNGDKLWPRTRRSYQEPEFISETPKPNISHRKNKMLSDHKSALVRNHLLSSTNNSTYQMDPDDNEQLLKIVMEGLGLQTLPDFKKANISQLEYSTKYNEYLDRVRKRAIPDFENIFDQIYNDGDANSSLSLLSIRHNSSDTKTYRERRSPATDKDKNKNKSKTMPTKSILLRFPLELNTDDIKASDIEEANIRLLLITSPALATIGQSKRRRHHHNRQNRIGTKHKKFAMDFNQSHQNDSSNATAFASTTIKEEDQTQKKHSSNKKKQSHFLNMKVYQLLEPKGKVRIDNQRIEIKIDRNKMDETTSQWLQFDVTKAVEEWLVNKKQNLGLEIQCDNCFRNGARIIDDLSGDSEEEDVEGNSDNESSTSDKYDLAPVLNIVGRLGTHREKRSKHHHNQMTEKPKRKVHKSNCYKDNQRCCRHSMEVVFKEIKGFEFIIQPKVFDAGYCRGRCPPRYNPAHHHALLQSLIWKQDRKKVPRPCCAPSKLIELEVLHVDEKDNEKLKISTWTDMRVLECACS